MAIEQIILKRAQTWLEGDFDEETKAKVKQLIENNPLELADAFYRDLEFGTGGLRGIMGVGTNRMNKYTVGMATQGLANYLIKMFPNVHPIKLAISFDSRNNSPYFARIVSEVLSANGFKVFLFHELRPTPELSFAIRYLGCQSGVMVTASHNPKEYNGYKAYWNDGAQMIAPHDKNVIEEVQKITSIDEVKWEGIEENIEMIGKEVDQIYLQHILNLSLTPDAIRRQKNLKIVYTPLHGTGVTLVPEILHQFGFENVTLVKEQSTTDGNFPTVHSPNPEEPDALKLALRKAREVDADLVLATDPDADRVGIALKNHKNEFVLINGNQTAALLFYYILYKWKENKMLTGNEFTIKTVVTTELLTDIANKFGVKSYDVLTGFKFIADIIRRNEGTKKFIVGGEESYGYLISDFVRDKDAVSACALIAEATAWMVDQGKTLFDLLISIYVEFAFYKESLLSITRKGKTGADEIRQMMIDYRNYPPVSINQSKVVKIKDYLSLKETDILSGRETVINLPKSDVLQFILADGSKISVRPSGTEPKIKFYFGVCELLKSKTEFDETENKLDKKLNDIIASMALGK
jgi:phosphoglucomutase